MSPAVGAELKDLHPCIVVQSDLIEHELRARTVVVPVTSRAPKRPLPFVIPLSPQEGGLTKESFAQCDQVTRIDKSRAVRRMGQMSQTSMSKINKALALVLEL
ncbi:type II toxin-antitoxin system PemK/MazF family toxin [bacterium]|nr:type II toxin-antitoxin system PemK/MazF family toxin [bacterium]